jgi:hypothetical protein
VEAEHRDHAVVEQVIADLKDQALEHFPSGQFNANGAWTVLGALAHNLLRWTQLLGLPNSTVRAARTLRRRLLQIAGRLTRHGRAWTLHLPARWLLARRLPRRARPDPRAPSRLTAAAGNPPTIKTPLARRARSKLHANTRSRPRGTAQQASDPRSTLARPHKPPPPAPGSAVTPSDPAIRWIRVKLARLIPHSFRGNADAASAGSGSSRRRRRGRECVTDKLGPRCPDQARPTLSTAWVHNLTRVSPAPAQPPLSGSRALKCGRVQKA